MALWQALRSAGRGALRLAAPPLCPACLAAAEQPGCCPRCRAALCHGADARLCRICAATLGPHLDDSHGCFACRHDRFAFQTVFRIGRYQGALLQACRRIKDESQRPLAAALADLLWELRGPALRAWSPDAVAPIPLHWRRRWRRGYDQADEIARRLAARLGVPCLRALRRVRHTPPQAELAPSVRRTNVAGAFAARGKPNACAVLLVDDILTTGATCHHAARALRSAGVERVAVATLARGEDFGKALFPSAPANAGPSP